MILCMRLRDFCLCIDYSVQCSMYNVHYAVFKLQTRCRGEAAAQKMTKNNKHFLVNSKIIIIPTTNNNKWLV